MHRCESQLAVDGESSQKRLSRGREEHTSQNELQVREAHAGQDALKIESRDKRKLTLVGNEGLRRCREMEGVLKIYSLVVGEIDRLLNTGTQDECLKLLNLVFKKKCFGYWAIKEQLKGTIVSSESEQLILSLFWK